MASSFGSASERINSENICAKNESTASTATSTATMSTSLQPASGPELNGAAPSSQHVTVTTMTNILSNPFANISALPSCLVNAATFNSNLPKPISEHNDVDEEAVSLQLNDTLSHINSSIGTSSTKSSTYKKFRGKSHSVDNVSYFYHPSNTFTLLRKSESIAEDCSSGSGSKITENLKRPSVPSTHSDYFNLKPRVNISPDIKTASLPEPIIETENAYESFLKNAPVSINVTSIACNNSYTPPCLASSVYIPAIIGNNCCLHSNLSQNQALLNNLISQQPTLILNATPTHCDRPLASHKLVYPMISVQSASYNDYNGTSQFTSTDQSQQMKSPHHHNSAVTGTTSCGTVDANRYYQVVPSSNNPLIASSHSFPLTQIVTNQPRPNEKLPIKSEDSLFFDKYLSSSAIKYNSVSTQTDVTIDTKDEYVDTNKFIKPSKETSGNNFTKCLEMSPKAKSCDSILDTCDKETNNSDNVVLTKIENGKSNISVVRKKSFIEGINCQKEKLFNFDLDDNKKKDKQKYFLGNNVMDSNKQSKSSDYKPQSNDFTAFLNEHLKQNKKLKNTALASGAGSSRQVPGSGVQNDFHSTSATCTNRSGSLLQHLQCHMPQSPTLQHRAPMLAPNSSTTLNSAELYHNSPILPAVSPHGYHHRAKTSTHSVSFANDVIASAHKAADNNDVPSVQDSVVHNLDVKQSIHESAHDRGLLVLSYGSGPAGTCLQEHITTTTTTISTSYCVSSSSYAAVPNSYTKPSFKSDCQLPVNQDREASINVNSGAITATVDTAPTCLSSNDSSPPTLSPSKLDDWIYLNIGGQDFTTSRATLILEEPGSMLAK